MAQLKDLIVNGPSRFVGNITANDSFTLGGPLTVESITSSTVYKINNNPLFIVSSTDPSTAPDFTGQLLIVNTSDPRLFYAFGNSSSSDWTFLLDYNNYSSYAVNLAGSQTITGSKTFNGNATFTGAAYHTGTLFMGSGSNGIHLTDNSINWHNASNSDQGKWLSFSSSGIKSHKSIYPNSNDLSLGSSESKWNNIYTQNASIANLNVSSSLTIGGVTLTASNGILTISGLVLALNGLTSATALSESSGTGSLIFTGPWSDYTSEKSDYALAASLGYDLHTRVTTLESKATNVKFTQVISAGKQIGTISIDGASTNIYAPSTYAWSEVTDRPTKLSQFTDDVVSGKYLSLSGGTMSNTNVVTSLNADLLDGYHANYFASAESLGNYLHLTGGALTGPLAINTSRDRSFILDEPSGKKYHIISFRANGEEYAYLCSDYTNPENLLKFNGSNILHAGNYNSYAPTLTGTGATGTWGINISGNAETATHATTLDGVYYQNILERQYSGVSRSITATGWFRIAETLTYDSYGTTFLLAIQRSVNYNYNESYLFSISISYHGAISITQLSGYANERLITKIRVDWTDSKIAYIDLCINSTRDNIYYWYTVGCAKSYIAWTANPTLVGTAYEFTTVQGCKSDRGFTGALIGNAASATKLATPRTIWGQSFDGTGNVSGALTGVTDITASNNIRADGTIYCNRGLSCYNNSGAVLSLNGVVNQSYQYNIYNNSDCGEGIRFLSARGGSSPIVFDSLGNVRIGTTSDSGDKLQVAGSILANLGNNGGVLIGRNGNTIDGYVNGTLTDLYLNYTSSGNLIMCYSGGKVGIGTAGPKYKLDVNGTFRSNAFRTSSGSECYWGGGGVDYGKLSWNTNYASVYATEGKDLRLGINDSPCLTISSSDNVGIGTTTPSEKLHVAGNILIDTGNISVLKLKDAYLTHQLRAANGDFFIENTNGTRYICIINNEDVVNVGILKKPSLNYALDVNGATYIGGNITATGAATIGSMLTVGGNIMPNANNVYTLGTSDYGWNNIYTKGISHTPISFVVSTSGWYRVYTSTVYSQGDYIRLNLSRLFYNYASESYVFDIIVGYQQASITQIQSAVGAQRISNVRVIFDGKNVYVDVYLNSGADAWYVSGTGRGTFQVGTLNTETANVFATLVPVVDAMVVGNNLIAVGAVTVSGAATLAFTLNVSDRATITGGITSKANHDFIAYDNEFNFIPDSFSSSVHFNYRTASDSFNGNVTEYVFRNGAGGYSDIRCKNLYATGNTLQIGSATLTWNGSALVVDKPLVSTSFAAGATATASSSGGGGSYGPVRINVTALCKRATSVPQSTLDSYGLTATVIENMADGLYTKVIDTQNRASWTYEAYIGANSIYVYLRQGDGQWAQSSIAIESYNNGSAWDVYFGEI